MRADAPRTDWRAMAIVFKIEFRLQLSEQPVSLLSAPCETSGAGNSSSPTLVPDLVPCLKHQWRPLPLFAALASKSGLVG